MDPHKVKDMTEEKFRTCYPNVSIQASPKAMPNVDRRQSDKPTLKTAVLPKTASVRSSTAALKSQLKSPSNVGVKTNIPVSKINTAVAVCPASSKTAVLGKPSSINKTAVATKSPAHAKTPVPGPMNKTPLSAVKAAAVKAAAAVKTPTSVAKLAQQKPALAKTPQTVLKQTILNMKTPMKPTTAVSPAVKADDAPDQSTTTVLTYHLPHSMPQRPPNQLTIEKIDHQQRIPVVLDTNNQMVLRQVVNTGQLVLQNKAAPAEPTMQSVVIGTSVQPASPVVAPLPQITTSEPLQALQVTQQVTLFRPKGTTFTVDDIKKQINLNKQNTMTNVVSSTTNSTSSPAPVPTQVVQPEQMKVPVPLRVQGVMQSPVRQSRRISDGRPEPKSVMTHNYPSTRGQVNKLVPKRIPMQKVMPMQTPPIPPPELLLGNEEEVTTSEELVPEVSSSTKLIVILPSGEKKAVTLSGELPLDYTIQELLERIKVPISGNNITAQISQEMEVLQGMEAEAQWDSAEHVVPEPGEIMGGLHSDIEADELDEEAAGQINVQTEEDDSHKDPDTANNEPIFREGLLAVCNNCGYTSINFNQCQRCNRKLPPNCKAVSSDFTEKSRKTKADSVTGDSPKKKRVCRRRRLEEPVCLTISDDEELLGLAHHLHMPEESFHSDSNSQMSSCDKEPVITDEMITEMKQSITGGGLEMQELLDNPSTDDRKTYLQCRTVRIGSYKVVPRDKVLITPRGLKVTVPVLNSDKFVELTIMYHEIIKVLIHFGRQLPVLFFYTRPAAAAKIRKALNMDDKKGFYYDTTSPDETHRRITFLPDKIDDDCKQTLKTIFGDPENNVFAELTGKEANDILVKASPKEIQALIKKKQPNNQQSQQPQPFNGQNIQTIMVYPPPPEKGGIPINTEDYACLGEDQFLNDVIIDFYLKYVVEKTLLPEDRARTHVFSSFFYKRLTTKPPAKRKSMNPVENDPKATAAEKRHSRVKSWTKNVNLFTKDFIVIPINENSHWFLAIICFAGLTGPVRFSDETPIDLPGRKKSKVEGDEAAVGVLSGKHTVTIGSTTITAVQNMSATATLDDDGEDRDEADGEDEDMDVPDCDEESVNKSIVPEIKEEPSDHPMTTRRKLKEPIKQPCILIFDSLAGASRTRVVATLREYLRVEYEAKHGEARDFGSHILKGTNLRCPQQTNYTDCGLYVLQYVEAFFQWPITDYRIPITQLQDWFQADIVSRKRYDIQQLLHRLMKEQNIDIEALNLPLLNLRPEGKHLVEYSGTEEEEEEEDDEDEEDEQMCEEEEDDMLDEDGAFNDDMGHDGEDMEDGEIGHHVEEDPDHYLDPNMEHEEHEIDEEDYGMMEDEEEDLQEEEMCDKELEDISLTSTGPVKAKELKSYRIPRLIRRDDMTDNAYKED